jgi:hypothetical protein
VNVNDRLNKRSVVFASLLALVAVVVGVSTIPTWSYAGQSSAKLNLKSVHPCSGNSLSAYEQHQGAGGSMYVFVIYLNSSKTDCSLGGYPAVSLYHSNGSPMKHESQRNSRWIPPRRVIISSGAVAGFVIQFADGAVSGVDPPQGCRAASSMEVKLPHIVENGQPFTSYFTISLAPCDGGGFSVTAIQRGQPQP